MRDLLDMLGGWVWLTVVVGFMLLLDIIGFMQRRRWRNKQYPQRTRTKD